MEDNNKYQFNVTPSPVDLRDLRVRNIYKTTDLPEELDYRESLQPIRDQGDQGSCAAMSSSAMKEWQEKMDTGLNEYMSPQFIYNNREGREEGMNTRDLMKILAKLGDCTERAYPYGSTSKITDDIFREAAKYTIDGYASVNGVNDLKTSLFKNGPCIIAVPVYNFTTRMWFKRPGDEFLGGHAQLAAGYLPRPQGGVKFIIRNSWGKTWGDRGYCYMDEEDFALAWEAWTCIDKKFVPEPIPNPEPPKHKCRLWRKVKQLFSYDI